LNFGSTNLEEASIIAVDVLLASILLSIVSVNQIFNRQPPHVFLALSIEIAK
jgi:NADH:ubiquinone oxidoreductase subunit K